MKTTTEKKFLLASVAGLGLLAATAFADKADYEGSMKMIPHSTASFGQNSSVLSEADKEALRKEIRNAQANGGIYEVIVAAWSDKALPAQGVKLTDNDRLLAKSRADAVENFLKSDLDVTDVETYSMAENSNWLARTFHTSDAKLKSTFSKRSTETPVTNAEFQVIKNEGGPSEAVIVVEKKAASQN